MEGHILVRGRVPHTLENNAGQPHVRKSSIFAHNFRLYIVFSRRSNLDINQKSPVSTQALYSWSFQR